MNKNTMIKALLIDAQALLKLWLNGEALPTNFLDTLIREVEFHKDGKQMLDDIHSLIGGGCDCMTIATYVHHENSSDILLVDDEGLLYNKPMPAVTQPWYPQALAGNILIVGLDDEDGDFTDVNMTRDTVLNLYRAQKIMIGAFGLNQDVLDTLAARTSQH